MLGLRRPSKGNSSSSEGEDDASRLSAMVKARGASRIEVKVSYDEEILFKEKIEIELTLVMPRALGMVETKSIMDSTWRMNRLGFRDKPKLEELLSLFESISTGLFSLLSASKTTADDADDADGDKGAESLEGSQVRTLEEQPSDVVVNASASMRKFEENLRVLGSALKSSIRGQSGEELDCLSQLVDRVENLFTRVKEHSRKTGDSSAEILTSKFVEFIFMTIEQVTARAAKRAKRDGNNDTFHLASKIGLSVHKKMITYGFTAGDVTQESLMLDHKHYSSRYLMRWHTIKHYFMSVLYLNDKTKGKPLVWTDFVGMMMAGLAMIVAVVIMWVAEKNIGRYSIELGVALVLGYILKDRIKEWGKRYIVPLVNFPQRITVLQLQGLDVGSTNEWVKFAQRSSTSEIDYSVKRSLVRPQDRRDRRDAGPENLFLLRHHVWLNEGAWQRSVRSLAGDLHSDSPGLVQLFRLDMDTLAKRVGQWKDTYTVIDPNTGAPLDFECPQAYRLRLGVKIKVLPRSKPWYKRICPSRVKAPKPRTVVDERWFVLLESEGVKSISKR